MLYSPPGKSIAAPFAIVAGSNLVPVFKKIRGDMKARSDCVPDKFIIIERQLRIRYGGNACNEGKRNRARCETVFAKLRLELYHSDLLLCASTEMGQYAVRLSPATPVHFSSIIFLEYVFPPARNSYT